MPEELNKTEARQGRTEGVVRYVLIISVVLAIVALVATFVLST